MKGLLPSGSSLFYLVLLLGLLYGVVWFSSTQYASTLRSFGVPVPYCTTHPLVSLCEMDYVVPSASYVSDTNEVSAFMFTVPSSKMLNALCSISENGANVRLVLTPLLKDNNVFMQTLDRCKIKYRFSNYVMTNELSTGRCYLDFTGTRGVYTCCKPIVSRFDSYFEEVWSRASP